MYIAEHSEKSKISPLQSKIPKKSDGIVLETSDKYGKQNGNNFNLRVTLESIHYTGKDYGYCWTFVVSILNRHWISNQIQIFRGKKSHINKEVFHKTIGTNFFRLQHLPITICAQHRNGFNLDTTLLLKPALFKKVKIPKSIFTELEAQTDDYRFQELHSVTKGNTKMMFVLNFYVTSDTSLFIQN